MRKLASLGFCCFTASIVALPAITIASTDNTVVTNPPVAALGAGQPDVGNWRIVQKVTGAPRKMPPNERQICLRDASDPENLSRLLVPTSPRGEPCTASKIDGPPDRLAWTSTCNAPMGTLNTQWQGSATATNAKGNGSAAIMGRRLQFEIVATRIGACAN